MAKAEKGFKGGYDVHLVNEVDEKHRCPYCDLLLRDPVQTLCGHRLCNLCLKDVLVKSGNDSTFICPACLEKNFVSKVYSDKFAAREIASFKTRCKFSSRCPWEGEVRDYEAHIRSCPYAEVLCLNEGCNKMVPQESLQKHMKSECNFRPVTCKKCKEVMPLVVRDGIHQDICPKKSVKCPYGCSKTELLREQLESHLKECPNMQTECTYHFAGCTFKGRRFELQKHLQDEMLTHMEMAATSFYSIKLELEEVKGKYEDGKKKTEELLTAAQSAERELKANRAKIDSLIGVQESLRAQMDDIQELIKRSSEQPLYMRSENSMTINNQLSQLQNQADMAESQIRELELSVREGAGAADPTGLDFTSGLFSMPSLMEPTIVPIERRLDNADKQLAMQDVQVAELNLKLQLLEVTSYNGTMIWKIDSVDRRRNDATRGKMPSLYSPPFFIGRFGYKVCARIYLNGDGMGKGKHVSLFFTIMRGEYDALLPWPFQQKVTFKILDLERSNHIIETFRPDPYSSSFRRPTSEMNLASGCPQFVEQTKVFRENTPYVKNNTMFVEITVDTSGLRLEL